MAQINTNRSYLTLLDESAWGDGGAGGNERLIPVFDGDYGVGLEDPIREQQHVQGDQDAFYAVQDVRNLRGSLKVGAWPHVWNSLLGYSLTRTAGALSSKAAKYVVPGIETRVHDGLMVDSLTIEGSQGGDVSMSMDLVGRAETTTSEPTYPGTFVVPAVPSLLFKNCRFVVSLDAGTTFANRIKPVGLSNFSITVRNNLKMGPAQENRVDTTLDGIIEFLLAGRVDMEMRFTAAFDRAAYGTLQRARKYAQFKLVAAHPAYTPYLTVDAGGAVAGTAVAVPVTTDPAVASPVFAVNDYVLFDGAGGGNPCVGKITAVDSVAPYGLTIDTLDENVAAGDHVFNAALELLTARMLVSTTVLNKPFDDFITVEVTGRVFSGGAAPLTWKAKDMTLP